jgi:hypothetical protein
MTSIKLEQLHIRDPCVPCEDLCVIVADCACSLTDVKDGARGCVKNDDGVQCRNRSRVTVPAGPAICGTSRS